MNVVLTDKIEPVGGVFLTFDIADGVWIQPEVLFSVKGSRVEIGTRDERISLRYLEVPVLLRYAAPRSRPVQLHLFAGPYAAFLMSASSRSPASERRMSLDGVFKSFDVGWAVGLGLGGGHAQVDLRYSGSVRDIANTSNLGGIVPAPFVIRSVTYRNRGFTLVVGYAF